MYGIDNRLMRTVFGTVVTYLKEQLHYAYIISQSMLLLLSCIASVFDGLCLIWLLFAQMCTLVFFLNRNRQVLHTLPQYV